MGDVGLEMGERGEEGASWEIGRRGGEEMGGWVRGGRRRGRVRVRVG